MPRAKCVAVRRVELGNAWQSHPVDRGGGEPRPHSADTLDPHRIARASREAQRVVMSRFASQDAGGGNLGEHP